MHLRAVTTEVIDDSLDRQNLTLLRKRFLQINHDRLLRTRMALTHQQEMLLDGLPLLFHCNHPMLPGFVSHSTPAGLSGFKVDKRQLSIGKAMARSFCLTGGHNGENIWGIYMMGSLGSLAQSKKSDFDVWLCHRPGLSKLALAELESKCKRITQWALTLRLEVHFFLMDCEAFRYGEQSGMDDESSGSAQRLLLLDEFYRTALYIGGRLPLWWFSPATREASYEAYTKELTEKRFVRQGTTLDFGGVSQIPDGEFIGAGIWQLYKAISSPYKSVLKLMLMEAYANDYPNITPLSMEYKRAVFNGELHVNELDPYVLAYRRIERYLKAEGDEVRLELARRCLYFKVNKPLTRPVSRRGKSWQRLLLESLIREWGWTEGDLRMLDNRSSWKTLRVKEERVQLVQALNHSYDTLQDFARRSGAARSISDRELKVLGRKLQAAFEKRPGKIDVVNPGISRDMTEEALTLFEQKDENGETTWQLFGSETGFDSPLKQSQSPVELLIWAHLNGLTSEHFRLDVSDAPSTNEAQIRRTLNLLEQWFPLPFKQADHDTFHHSATPSSVFMLINAAAEKPSPFGPEIHRLSDQSDPFSYGSLKENLVASVDVLVVNSWQEVSCQRFEGKAALIKALESYLELCMPGSHQAPPILAIDSVGFSHSALLTQRAKQWFHEVCACYFSTGKPPSTRYLFELAGRNYSLQYSGAKLVVLEHKSIEQLMHYLGEPQKLPSPIVVDNHALHNKPIKIIAKRMKTGGMCVFYQRKNKKLLMSVVDNHGSVIEFTSMYTPDMNSLHSLHAFMRETLHSINISVGDFFDFGVCPIEFFEIKEDDLHHLSAHQRNISPELSGSGAIQVGANVGVTQSGRFEYNFDCEGQCFPWSLLKQDIFHTVANHILELRKSHTYYPVFISSLNLDQCKEQLNANGELQISHYLRVKADLENKLNKALLNRKL